MLGVDGWGFRVGAAKRIQLVAVAKRFIGRNGGSYISGQDTPGRRILLGGYLVLAKLRCFPSDLLALRDGSTQKNRCRFGEETCSRRQELELFGFYYSVKKVPKKSWREAKQLPFFLVSIIRNC